MGMHRQRSLPMHVPQSMWYWQVSAYLQRHTNLFTTIALNCKVDWFSRPSVKRRLLRVFKLDCAWTLSTPVWLSHVYPWHHAYDKCTRLPPFMVWRACMGTRLTTLQIYVILRPHSDCYTLMLDQRVCICHCIIPVVAMPPTCEARWLVLQHQSKLPSYHGLLASA